MKSIKKISVLLLIALMSVGVANAQFRFGVKAGLNVNSLNTNLTELKDNAAGFTGGIMTEFEVPIIGLCFDLSLMYSRLNSQPSVVVSENGQNEVLQADQTKNFLQIPLNLKYKFKLPIVGSFLSPYLFTGPDFAIKLGKNTLSDFKTKTCQVAWNVGLGLELVKHLQIGASYGFGINNIVDKVAGNYIHATDLNIKNNYWTITAAYLF